METISLFDDTVQWHMSAGATKLEATHRAIDEYRKFTRRQIQGETYDIMSETILSEDSVTPEDEIHASQIFSKMIELVINHPQVRKSKTEMAVKLVCCLFRMNGLEEIMGETEAEFINKMLGNFFPETEMEIAEFLGYSVRKSTGSCGMMTEWKQWLSRAAGEMGLKAII